MNGKLLLKNFSVNLLKYNLLLPYIDTYTMQCYMSRYDIIFTYNYK